MTRPLLGRQFMIYMEPKMRIELTTYALRVRCSTPELPGRVTNLKFTAGDVIDDTCGKTWKVLKK